MSIFVGFVLCLYAQYVLAILSNLITKVGGDGMSKMKFIVFIMCIVLGAVGCTSGGIINQVPKLEGEGNLEITVSIPESMLAGSVGGQGEVVGLNMVQIAEVQFRLTRKSDKMSLEPYVVPLDGRKTASAFFRLSAGDWFIEIVALDSEGHVILRDQESLKYWEDYRAGTWRPWHANAFPRFVNYRQQGETGAGLKEINITANQVKQENGIMMNLEHGYVVVQLAGIDTEKWQIQSGSGPNFKVSITQPDKASDFVHESNIFSTQVNFYEVPIGGWLVDVELRVQEKSNTDNKRILKSNRFIDVYGGRMQVVEFEAVDL